MERTTYGEKQIASNECRWGFLALAVTHLKIHHTPESQFADSLRLIVARYLAGTDEKHRFAVGSELDNYEEFIEENRKLIDAEVQRAIEGALGTENITGEPEKK